MEAAALPRADATHVAVIGLGYVGLPLAVGFGRTLPTLGFDINKARIAELREFRDHTLETSTEELKAAAHLKVSDNPADLRDCNVFIVTVPTPIDGYKRPDLSPLESASRTVGKVIRPGGVVVFESTVYPGATEEVCVPIIERESGLKYNVDWRPMGDPFVTKPGDLSRAMQDAVEEATGLRPRLDTGGGTSDGRFIAPTGTQVIEFGPKNASIHKIDECVSVSELEQLVDIYVDVLKRLLG